MKNIRVSERKWKDQRVVHEKGNRVSACKSPGAWRIGDWPLPLHPHLVPRLARGMHLQAARTQVKAHKNTDLGSPLREHMQRQSKCKRN